MGFNFDKCKIMKIGNQRIHQDKEFYFQDEESPQNSHLLQTCNSERDLGIIIRNDLKWEDQVKSSTNKAHFALSRLKRAFTNWTPKTFRILYSTYVRPHLEYAAVAWRPYKKQEVKALEKIQRTATKCVPSIRNKSYNERLKILGLTSLEDRRQRGDLIQLFKFEQNFNDIDWYHPLNRAPNTTVTGPANATRSSKRKYRQLVKGCPPRQNFFTNRTAEGWNELPEEITSSKSVENFKEKHDKYFYK